MVLALFTKRDAEQSLFYSAFKNKQKVFSLLKDLWQKTVTAHKTLCKPNPESTQCKTNLNNHLIAIVLYVLFGRFQTLIKKCYLGLYVTGRASSHQHASIKLETHNLNNSMEQQKPCESTESSPEPFLRKDFQANIISIGGIWISARWYNRLHCFSEWRAEPCGGTCHQIMEIKKCGGFKHRSMPVLC